MKALINSGLVIPVFDKRDLLIEELKKKGYEVTISGYQKEGEICCKEHGTKFKYISMSRSGLNPIIDLKTIYDYFKLIKKEKYDVINSYTAKPNIYGSIGARMAGVKEIYPTVNGLGYAFTGNGLKNKMVRFITCILYKIAFSCAKKVFFQNKDDMEEMVSRHVIKKEKCVVISGSGIDLDKYRYSKVMNTSTFLFASRLLKTKGIEEFLHASEIVKEKYPKAKFIIAGSLDETNPDGISKEYLEDFIQHDNVEYLGRVNDMPKLLKEIGVFVLPSYYREGVPHAVLEAMSIGRCIITTNRPGCKETINGKNGFLIEPKDSKALAEKMIYLIENEEITKRMCQESRKYAEDRFDAKKVNKLMLETMKI